MEIRIDGHTITKFSEASISLRYDSVADAFNVLVYFNPDDATDKKLYKPCTYKTARLYHGGVLIMTGTVLNHQFSDAGDPPASLVRIQGYSISGILDDCNVGIAKDSTLPAMSNQFDGHTLPYIAENLCAPFPLKVITDPELLQDAVFMTPYTTATIEQNQYITDFLNDLCKQKNVVLSHNNRGDVIITRPKADKLITTTETLVKMDNVPVATELEGAPSDNAVKQTTTATNRAILYDFSDPSPTWYKMDLDVNGQALHSKVQVIGQQGAGDPPSSEVTNGMVQGPTHGFKAGYRLRREIQTIGDVNTTQLNARALAGAELKSTVLTIEMQGWTLGGHLVTPNQMITVTNKKLHMYRSTKWFIREVQLFSNVEKDTATLICVLPACFNNDPLVNVF